MATQLTPEATRLRMRVLAAVVGVLLVVAALAGWRALSSGPDIVVGTVAVVNADGTKFCVNPEPSGDQWCGRLATSGGESIARGSKVRVLVNSLDAEPGGTLNIGTVVPSDFTVK